LHRGQAFSRVAGAPRSGDGGRVKLTRARDFRAERAWGAWPIMTLADVSVKVHWTDQPYRWHVNDGAEVFAVLDGVVEMRYRVDGAEHAIRLEAGDVLAIDDGEEHVAHPVGEARILVVERAGSA
jgi:mannose-6-phosphate isomerase-like protein (cupin superfamily)